MARRLALPRLPRGWAEWVEWALLAAALAVPAAMLTDIVPWWRAGLPGVTFSAIFAFVLVAATVAAGLATARHRALGPLGGVAGGVVIAIGLDVLTGARLQLDGVTGYSALAGPATPASARSGWACSPAPCCWPRRPWRSGRPGSGAPSWSPRSAASAP
jgi:hypothetical protein